MILNMEQDHFVERIQKHIEDRLSEELLKGTVLTGQNVMIDVVDDEFVICTSESEPESQLQN